MGARGGQLPRATRLRARSCAETAPGATTVRVLDFPTYDGLAQRLVDLRRAGKEVLLRL